MQPKKNGSMKKLEINFLQNTEVIFLNKIPIGFISMESYIEKVKTSWGYYM